MLGGGTEDSGNRSPNLDKCQGQDSHLPGILGLLWVRSITKTNDQQDPREERMERPEKRMRLIGHGKTRLSNDQLGGRY